MLAETQLELRSQLGLALFSLGRLAEEIGMQPNPVGTLNSLVNGLKDPFLFVVAGEVNAGKSMLLNALFGEEFCRTSALPSTDKIHYFRFGLVQEENELGPNLKEVLLPRRFLQDFHVVDTPGINSVAEGHEAITEQFLPRADAVVFVLPVTNPWGAKSWEFLHHIHEDLGKRVVLVLQQIDLRTEQEVQAIAEHVRVCARKWLGRDIPVLCVSARKALLARTSGVGKTELLQQSAIEELEREINDILATATGKLDRISNTLHMGNIMLSQLNQCVMEKSCKLTSLGAVLQKVGAIVQEQKSESWETCLVSLKPLDAVLQRICREMPARLNPEMDGWRIALQPATSATGKAAAGIWHQDARAALESHTLAVEKSIRGDLENLWANTKGPISKALGKSAVATPDLNVDVESLRQDHENLLVNLRSDEIWGQAARLQSEQRRQRLIVSALLAGLGIVAALVGGIGGWWWLLVPGLGLIGLAGWMALQARKLFLKTFPVKLQECCINDAKRVRQMADVALQKWLQRCFQNFSVNFKPLLDRSEQLRTQEQTHLEGIENIRKTLAELGRQLKI